MSAAVNIGFGLSALVDAEMLPYLEGYNWRANGRGRDHVYAGCLVRIGGKQRFVSMHRLIAGARMGEVVDHINGNTLDNRQENLRRCTPAENMRNRRMRKTARRYKGVEPRRSRWCASIMLDGVQRRLGGYETDVEAACAYDRAALELHGEFASLNFAPSRDWVFLHQHEPRVAA